MTIKRLFAIALILVCTAAGWAILGTSLVVRSQNSSGTLSREVAGVWGPPMTQPHPSIWYGSATSPNGRRQIQPVQSKVQATLNYEPKKRGLLWHRTFLVDFRGTYTIENPAPIPQTIYVKFQFPAANASYDHFEFLLNGQPSASNRPTAEGIIEAVLLAPGERAVLKVGYKSRGTDLWTYTFGDTTRVQNFELLMRTDFEEISFPAGTGSPTSRQRETGGWNLVWSYPDVIGALPIGMDLPKVLNPGPVASRITFFAPVSLLFFFAVLVIMAAVWRVDLHPMNYFFLAAGFFAFQLLFAYLVDLLPLLAAFGIASAVSLILVSGYLLLAAGRRMARLAVVAQFAYMVLFSYSFFFDGLSGLVIAIGAVLTLALLMIATAKVNWGAKFSGVPPLPTP